MNKIKFYGTRYKTLVHHSKTARINIVGQAPGIRAQESGLYWNDPSGDNLRDWMGVSREEFYESGMFAIVPMDFLFPRSWEIRVIYLLAKDLQTSGMRKFLL